MGTRKIFVDSKEGIITVVQNWGGGRNMKSFSTKYG